MQVKLDVNLAIKVIVLVLASVIGLVYLVKRKVVYDSMPGLVVQCFVCGNSASKKCSRCKAVRYCSPKCQQKHWHSGHKNQCLNKYSGIALGFLSRPCNVKQPKRILFPYDEFLNLFSWDNPQSQYPPPCGLLNCGNSCFANVVLQCLASTRPLVAYLLQKGHRSQCIRTDWCFLCELQTHLERATQTSQPFSPTNIISRLPNIGGNLGYGRQEDAHEFMRFAIDAMQSVCLDEFGGERAVPPTSRETTLIQHIFGGRLQSQVICTECNIISNQYENMMDLTVEIHGEAASLEECLDQFTKREWLDGENMYKCDGCNDYVKAWKRLSVKCPPNILTIALKRFQSGRFGKLNKRVSFPERLELSRYTNNEADAYNLYAVVVHVDTLNASYFGHYICYIKDLSGCSWYRLDDCKVGRVELEEVLCQSAYMLLYSRVKARASCLLELPKENEKKVEHCVPNGNGNGHCVEDDGSVNDDSKQEEEEYHNNHNNDDDSSQLILNSNGEIDLPVPPRKDNYDTTTNGHVFDSHQHEEEACNSSNGDEGEITIHNNNTSTSFKCCGVNNTFQNGFHDNHHHDDTVTTIITDENLL